MDDFFARLARRLVGATAEVRPVVAPPFAPVPEDPPPPALTAYQGGRA